MVDFNRDDRTEILQVWSYAILTIGISLFGLWALGGAENEVNLIKFFTYPILTILGTGAITGIVWLKYTGWFEEAGNEEYFGFQYITFHSPESTWLAKQIPSAKYISNHIAFGTIFFMITGIAIGTTGTLVYGDPGFVQGQATELGQTILAVEPAVSGETMFFHGLLQPFFIGVMCLILFSRVDVSKGFSVVISKILSIPFTALAFLVYHNARYPNSETSQLGILLLGTVDSTLTAITNSIILADLFHRFGNLFDKIASMNAFNNEGIVVLGIILIMMIFFILALLRKPRFLFQPFED